MMLINLDATCVLTRWQENRMFIGRDRIAPDGKPWKVELRFLCRHQDEVGWTAVTKATDHGGFFVLNVSRSYSQLMIDVSHHLTLLNVLDRGALDRWPWIVRTPWR